MRDASPIHAALGRLRGRLTLQAMIGRALLGAVIAAAAVAGVSVFVDVPIGVALLAVMIAAVAASFTVGRPTLADAARFADDKLNAHELFVSSIAEGGDKDFSASIRALADAEADRVHELAWGVRLVEPDRASLAAAMLAIALLVPAFRADSSKDERSVDVRERADSKSESTTPTADTGERMSRNRSSDADANSPAGAGEIVRKRDAGGGLRFGDIDAAGEGMAKTNGGENRDESQRSNSIERLAFGDATANTGGGRAADDGDANVSGVVETNRPGESAAANRSRVDAKTLERFVESSPAKHRDLVRAYFSLRGDL